MNTPGTDYPLFESAEEQATEQPTVAPRFSDYVVYVDESGDHSLASIDKDYPVFVLALCVFHKRHYAEKIIPAVEKLKFNYFGHDSVVLHENEIRKQKGDFAFLSHLPTRQAFMRELSSIMDASNFILIACVVDKAGLDRQGDHRAAGRRTTGSHRHDAVDETGGGRCAARRRSRRGVSPVRGERCSRCRGAPEKRSVPQSRAHQIRAARCSSRYRADSDPVASRAIRPRSFGW